MEVAARLRSEVVSADSMQVYRQMDIGTAKPGPATRRVPHHCIDLVDPGEPFSAALYQQAARTAIARITTRGSVPVLTGGTGLYVRAALDDMRFPAGKDVMGPARKRYEDIAEQEGGEALWRRLQQRDAASADAIHPNNIRRVVRALEMLDAGVSYAEQASGFDVRESIYDAVIIGLNAERTRLYERIDARVDLMIAEGLLAEVEQLMASGFTDALTAQQAIGYKELVPVVEGTVALSDAIASIKRSTRRYAKRQLTWFRADPRIRWIDVADRPATQVADDVLALLA